MNKHFKNLANPKYQMSRIFSDCQGIKTIIILCILICASINLQAQNDRLKRDVLFTLGVNEIIISDEYFVMQSFNQNRFTCVVRDTLKKAYTFVFNGKRVVSTNRWIEIKSINLNEENGYIFSYNDFYVNYKGIEDGPFESCNLYNPYDYRTVTEDCDYYYQLAGRWYGHKNGNNKLIPQKSKIDPVRDVKNEKYYITINDTRISIPAYDKIEDLQSTESGKYAYTYKKDGKYYANINGTISPAYDDLFWDLQLTESGKYAYTYGKGGKWHANINGTISPAYDNYIYALQLTESGKYAYICKKDGKRYANINGTISSACDQIWNLTIDNSGIHSYQYKTGHDGITYQNNNGRKSPAESFEEVLKSVDETEIYSANQENSFYSTYKYEYVVIDGRRFGKAPSLRAWYNKDKNTFVWNAIEGRELVVYEYKLG
jgi:hypothetical protein